MGRVCSQSLLPTRHGREPGATPELSRHRPRPVGTFTCPRRFHPNPLVIGSGNGGRQVGNRNFFTRGRRDLVKTVFFSPWSRRSHPKRLGVWPAAGRRWPKRFVFRHGPAVPTPNGLAIGLGTAGAPRRAGILTKNSAFTLFLPNLNQQQTQQK